MLLIIKLQYNYFVLRVSKAVNLIKEFNQNLKNYYINKKKYFFIAYSQNNVYIL